MANEKQKGRFKVGDRVLINKVQWIVEKVYPDWKYKVSIDDNGFVANAAKEQGWSVMFPDHSEMSKFEVEKENV